MKTGSYQCLKRESFGQSSGYQLITIRPEDIEQIRLWRNAQMEVLRQKDSISSEEQQSYFNQHIWPSFGEKHPKQILFSYLCKDNLIGYGGVVHINWNFAHAEVSFLSDPSRRNHYEEDFTHFLKLLREISFIDLNFHRLYAETFAFRTGHMHILEKVGFKQEGIFREHIFKKNQWHDSFLHGLLVTEFPHER